MSDNVTLDGPINVEQGWPLFLAVSAICMSVTAVTSNAVLMGVILLTRSLRTPTNAFIISLAVGEILIGLCHLPFVASSLLAHAWPFSLSACRASASLRVIGRTAGTLSLMSMCVDRCVAVSRPLAYSQIITFKFAAAMLSVAWTLAFVMGFLPLGTWGHYGYSAHLFACVLRGGGGGGGTTPSGRGDRPLAREIVCTFVPAAVIVTCLIVVVKQVKGHHRVFALFPVPSVQMVVSAQGALPSILPGARSFNRNTMKALRPLFVTCFLYGLFCLPRAVLYVVGQTWPLIIPGLLPLAYAVVWLSFFSSILNPFMVILFKRKFRDRVKSMCRFRRRIWTPKVHKEPFTISTGLQAILSETTWVGSVAKPGMKSSVRGQPTWTAIKR